jgi:hypothetical protein
VSHPRASSQGTLILLIFNAARLGEMETNVVSVVLEWSISNVQGDLEDHLQQTAFRVVRWVRLRRCSALFPSIQLRELSNLRRHHQC